MNISFYGAAGMVTGTCYLLEFNGKKCILDCGLFQGSKETEELNYKDFPFNPAEIDFCILSHAHIDHSGRIPLLVKGGFRGKIYSTKPTRDLCSVMLPDSGHIQEKEAEWKTNKALRKGMDAIEPLYTVKDAEESLKYFHPVLYNQTVKIDDEFIIRFRDAGHILGSSIVEIWIKNGTGSLKVVFSGDLGMKGKPIIRDPEIISEADYLIIESTYGDRIHENFKKTTEALANIILETARKKGTVVIPSFAVGRTQELIYELNMYYDGNSALKEEFSSIPVYIDSPLAAKATKVFMENSHVFDEEAREKIFSGDNPLEFKNLFFTETTEESKMINLSEGPKIIISASGMCDAGRIRHHLKHNLWKKDASVIFVGYQAEGTLGRQILEGAKKVKIFGEEIAVKAHIYNLEGFSAHADKDGLIEWLQGFEKKPKKVFIVHGEEDSRIWFSGILQNILKYDTIVPGLNSSYSLDCQECIEQYKGIVFDKDIPADEKDIAGLSIKIGQLEKLLEESGILIKEKKLTEKEYNEINNSTIEIERAIIDLASRTGS